MTFPWKKALLTGLLGALTVALFTGAAVGVHRQSERKIAGIHWMLEQPADQPLLAEQDLRQLAV